MRVRNSEQFGKIIREARKSAKLTQVDLAGSCGTGVRFIVGLEHGKVTWELDKSPHVAFILG